MTFPAGSASRERADQKIARPRQSREARKLTFRWALQFPPPSFLARRRQAVFLLFLRVLLFPAGQESVLLGRAQDLTMGAVLCPAGGRVSRDPVFHLPLLLFGEAGVGRPVSVPAHVSIVDLCHGRPTHPSVALAHTHTIFEGAKALNLQAEEEEARKTSTSWQFISFIDCYCGGSMLQFDVLKVCGGVVPVNSYDNTAAVCTINKTPEYY